jgi:archaellum component FlaC
MGCLIMKCHCLDVSLSNIDGMSKQLADIKESLAILEKTVQSTLLKPR